MMIISNPDLIFLLTSKALKIYNPDGEEISFIYPPDVVANQEILSQPRLEKLLAQFFVDNNLRKQKAILLIAEDLLYCSKISLQLPSKDQQTHPESLSPDQLEEKINHFLDEVPFAPNNLAVTRIDEADGVMVCATNQNLYQTVRDIFEKIGNKVLSVLPITVLGQFSGSPFQDQKIILQLSREQIHFLFKNSQLWKKGDLFAQKPTSEDISEKVGSGSYSLSRRRMVIIIGLGFLLLIGLVIGWFYIFQHGLGAPLKIIVASPTPTPISSNQTHATNSAQLTLPSPTPNVIYKSPQELQAQVLNGSGISGQAAKVRQLLTQLGIQNISVGNSPRLETISTEIQFSPQVSPQLQTEIQDKLKEIFVQVEKLEASPEGKLDILILTGDEKS